MSEMKIVKGMVVPLLFFLLFGLGMNSGLAYEQKTYSLQITLDASCRIPFCNYQSVSPIDVSFQLENTGNETFNGTLTLEASTDKKHSWNAMYYNIENLAPNDVYSNSTSYSSIDDGLYYFTATIVPNATLSNIKLYEGSNMIAEGDRVHTGTTISIHSFTEFIAIVAIVVTIILAIIGFAIQRNRRKKR
jgi:hypothetical protein